MKTLEEERQRKRLPRKRAARRNRTVFRDERSRGKGEPSGPTGPRRRMPVLVSGVSFACNFVRGSYLEVRVTTSQPVPGGRFFYLFLASSRPSTSFIQWAFGLGITRTHRQQPGRDRAAGFFSVRASGEAPKPTVFGNHRQLLKMTSYRNRREQRSPE